MVCLNCVRVKTPEVYIFGIQKYLLFNLCLLFTSLLDLKSCSSFLCFLTFLLLLLALYCPGPGGAPLPHTPMLLLSVSESSFFFPALFCTFSAISDRPVRVFNFFIQGTLNYMRRVQTVWRSVLL